jgi:hypothetical protein
MQKDVPSSEEWRKTMPAVVYDSMMAWKRSSISTHRLLPLFLSFVLTSSNIRIFLKDYLFLSKHFWHQRVDS